MNFHQDVYLRFQKIASLYSDRIKLIKCKDKAIDEIHQEILHILNEEK